MHRRTLAFFAALALVTSSASAQRVGAGGPLSIGPLVGSAPGADVHGERVPTVGIVGDLALVRMGWLGLHVGGTLEHRAGAEMRGMVASAVVPIHRRLALRAGAAMGDAETRVSPWVERLGWRDWRGVDAGLELRLGRTTGALMVRTGTMDQYAPGCPPTAGCAVPDGLASAPAARFTRVSFESRYALFR